MTDETALALHEDTGELVETGMTAIQLRTVAETHAALSLARLKKADMERALREEIEEYGDACAEEARLAKLWDDLEDQINSAQMETLRERTGASFKIETPFLTVTWPRPAERVVQDLSPRQILEDDPDLAKLLGIHVEKSKPAKARIKIDTSKLS